MQSNKILGSEFNLIRYSLGEIIKSEKVFSQQARDVVTVIQNILDQYNDAVFFKPFNLTEIEIKLLQKSQQAFKILAEGENIWQEMGGNLNIENKNGHPFVSEPIEIISTFFVAVNQNLTTKDEHAPFNQRFQACIFLSSVHNDLSNLFTKKLKKHADPVLYDLQTDKKQKPSIESFVITPIQRVARWPLLINTLKNQLNDILKENENNIIVSSAVQELAAMIRSPLRKFTNVAVIVNRCTGAIQSIIKALNLKKITDSKRNLIVDNLAKELRETMVQSVMVGKAENEILLNKEQSEVLNSLAKSIRLGQVNDEQNDVLNSLAQSIAIEQVESQQIEVIADNDNLHNDDLDESELDELMESQQFITALEDIMKSGVYTQANEREPSAVEVKKDPQLFSSSDADWMPYVVASVRGELPTDSDEEWPVFNEDETLGNAALVTQPMRDENEDTKNSHVYTTITNEGTDPVLILNEQPVPVVEINENSVQQVFNPSDEILEQSRTIRSASSPAIFFTSSKKIEVPAPTEVPETIIQAEVENKLYAMIRAGDVAGVQVLLEQDYDIDTKDEKGNTALHIAARTGQAEVVEILLKNNANIYAVNNNGETALHVALDRRLLNLEMQKQYKKITDSLCSALKEKKAAIAKVAAEAFQSKSNQSLFINNVEAILERNGNEVSSAYDIAYARTAQALIEKSARKLPPDEQRSFVIFAQQLSKKYVQSKASGKFEKEVLIKAQSQMRNLHERIEQLKIYHRKVYQSQFAALAKKYILELDECYNENFWGPELNCAEKLMKEKARLVTFLQNERIRIKNNLTGFLNLNDKTKTLNKLNALQRHINALLDNGKDAINSYTQLKQFKLALLNDKFVTQSRNRFFTIKSDTKKYLEQNFRMLVRS